jgi:uncharacterized protein
MSFLKAEWRKLSIINYEIDPSLLAAYVPYGTELDLYQNKCYVSLIGFMFVNTRLLGIKIPFHTDFEEVNLRFYVKRYENNEWKRGVVFIKEIVPKAALTFVANTIYNENYETLPMDHEWIESPNQHIVQYRWKKNHQWNHIRIVAENNPKPIAVDTELEFITEHYWGYARINDTCTNEYEVTHPRWEHYKVLNVEINADFSGTYGPQFGFLVSQKPISIMLAEGSKISVESKKTIKK